MQPPCATVAQKLYWIGRIERRVRFLKLKLASAENQWELKELEALEWAIIECKRAVKSESQMLTHFSARFKEMPGSDSNGS